MTFKLVAVAAAVVCLGAGVGTAAPAAAGGQPQAGVGLHKDSYTSPQAAFVIALSARAGLASYDVRRAVTPMRARHRAAWALPPALQNLPTRGTDASPRLVLPISRGQVVCVSARARDVDGTTGPWSAPSCAIRALDDSALARRGHSRVVRDGRYWGGRASEIGIRGRLLLRGVPRGSRVVVLCTDLNQDNPRFNGRGLPFTVPARRGVQHYLVGWRWGPTRYTQVIWTARASGRRGPVVFQGGQVGQGTRWTSPLEGVVVRPRWL